MRRYRVLLPLRVHLTEEEGGGSYAQGEVFEKEFSVEDEAENVASGLIGIEPAEYKVVGTSSVFDTAPGETFEAAMPLGQEQLLVEGGHIERVEPAKPKRTKKGGTT